MIRRYTLSPTVCLNAGDTMTTEEAADQQSCIFEIVRENGDTEIHVAMRDDTVSVPRPVLAPPLRLVE